MSPVFLILSLWICAIFAWGIGLFILYKRNGDESLAFALNVIAVGVYCAGYGGEISANNLDEMLFWSKVQYFGIAAAPAFWMEFALSYTGRAYYVHGFRRLFLWAIPTFTIVAHLLDKNLGLVYREASMDVASHVHTLSLTPGPLYYINVAFSVFCLCCGATILGMFGRNRMGLYRRQIVMLVLSAILPILSLFIYFSGHNPFGNLDLTPFALFGSIALVYVAVIRQELTSLSPVARDFIVEHLPQGVMVFDKRRRLCEANESARALLAFGPDCIGKVAAEILIPPFAEKALPDSGRTTFDISINGRDLEVQTYIIDRDKNERLGWVVSLIDISERKRVEARLERVLRSRKIDESSGSDDA